MRKLLLVLGVVAAGIVTGSSIAGAEPVTFHDEYCFPVPADDFDTICVVADEVRVQEGATTNVRFTAVLSYYLGGTLVDSVTDERHFVSANPSEKLLQGITIAKTSDGCGFVDMYVNTPGTQVMNFRSHCPG